MSWRAIGIGLLAATALSAAGCGGGGDGDEVAAGGTCATAKADLKLAVA